MSGDVTEQSLARLSHLPDNPSNPAEMIAAQKYYDVEFTGGSIANVTLTDVTINGITTTPTLRIVTTAGGVTPASDDYTIVIKKTVPESTAVLLSAAQTSGRRLEIKDGAGNAASYHITLTGTVDGETNPTISTDYGSRILEYNGTEWNVIASADSSEGVVGPGSATDNAIARFDGATGSVIQNSTVTVGDTGVVAGASIDTAAAANILKVNGTSLTAVSGTGAVALVNAPTFIGPALGTPASGVATNLTGTATALNIGGNAATASAVAVGGITGLGTGVATALAVNVGTAGAPVINGGALGTPSSGTATNLTGTATALNIGGNAATATTATTSTTATNATNTAITEDTTTNATMYPTWVTANTGNLPQKTTSTKLSFNPSTGVLSSTSFTGAGTGLTGTASSLTAGTASAVAIGGITGLGTGVAAALATNVGSAGAPVLFNGAGGTPSSMTATNLSGTAASLTAGLATALANARTIGGVSFDGTTNITVATATGGFTVTGGGLVLAAGTTSLAPLKFLSGTSLTTPVTGVLEFDGSNFFITI